MKIEAENCSFSYMKEAPVFKDLSMFLEQGHSVAILGPNGIGKTSFLKCLLGFEKPQTGRILVDGKDRAGIGETEFFREVSYVPQNKKQTFPYTVEETVLMGRTPYLSAFQQPSNKDREMAAEAMQKTGIQHLAQKTTDEISGGELQLTYIARALAAKPQVLIMDEPETGLDYRNQMIVMNLIESLSRDEHLSVLFTTHYPEHAASMCSEVLLMNRDGSTMFGKTDQVLTAENTGRAFGVKIHIERTVVNGKEYVSMIPLETTDRGD
jgi:iron complex transport system ATP-binding protein